MVMTTKTSSANGTAQHVITKPPFTLALLHLNIGVFGSALGYWRLSLTVLPYRILLLLGRSLGSLGARYGKKRVAVAARNLELAFPDKPADEVAAMVSENFKNTGMALIETGITWFWPTWRFKRILVDKDTQMLRTHKANGKGVLCAVCMP